jgi:hypothetical protein
MITGYEKPGGKVVKIKVVGQFGITVAGNSYFPDSVLEVDEFNAGIFIRQGRAVEVVEVEAPPLPAEPPVADHDEHAESDESSEVVDDEGDPREGKGKGKKKK